MKKIVANRLMAMVMVVCMVLAMAAPACALDEYYLELVITENMSVKPSGKSKVTVGDKSPVVSDSTEVTPILVQLLIANFEGDAKENKSGLWDFESDQMGRTIEQGLAAYRKSEDDWYDWLNLFAGKSEITGEGSDKTDLVDLLKGNKTVGDMGEVGTSYTLTYTPVDVASGDPARGNTYVFTLTLTNDDSEVDYPTLYAVDVSAASNATVTVSREQAVAGEEITVTISINSGYKMEAFAVKDASGDAVTTTKTGDGVYKFTMPAESVDVILRVSKVSSGGGSSSGGSSSDNTTTDTTTDSEGNTTTTETKTDVTTGSDGSTTTTQTSTSTTKDPSGNETGKTESSTTTTTKPDGSTTTTTESTTTDSTGNKTESKTESSTTTDSTGTTTESTTTTETSKDSAGNETGKTESSTTTTTKPDGSTTTTTESTTTDSTGNKTESKTESSTTTDASGTKTEVSNTTQTTTNADGGKSQSSETKTAESTKDASGNTTTNASVKLEIVVEVPEETSQEAIENDTHVSLPMQELPAVESVTTTQEEDGTKTTTIATVDSTVTIITNVDENVKVEIPVQGVGPGIVAVIIEEDGSEKIIRDSIVTEDGLRTSVSSGDKILIKDNTKTFDDVPDNHWGKDAVTFVAARDLFAGTGNNKFEPELPTNRGMVVQVIHNVEYNMLHNLDGHYFHDVLDHHWYDDAVHWGEDNNVVAGYGDGTFRGEQIITREELVVMLWNYAGKKSSKFDHHTEGFWDRDKVSSWAWEAMNWGLENGILVGKGSNTLDPGGLASRIEMAQMFKNYIEHIME